jgi:hypothetical protein
VGKIHHCLWYSVFIQCIRNDAILGVFSDVFAVWRPDVSGVLRSVSDLGRVKDDGLANFLYWLVTESWNSLFPR